MTFFKLQRHHIAIHSERDLARAPVLDQSNPYRLAAKGSAKAKFQHGVVECEPAAERAISLVRDAGIEARSDETWSVRVSICSFLCFLLSCHSNYGYARRCIRILGTNGEVGRGARRCGRWKPGTCGVKSTTSGT